MSLQNFQITLLRLYSNKRDLTDFITNLHYLEDKGLSEREARALRGIPIREMSRFQSQLHEKSIHVAMRFLHPRRVCLTILHPKGPSLMWGTPTLPKSTALTPAQYALLHRLSRSKQKLTLAALVREQAHAPLPPRDLFSLVSLMYRHGLTHVDIRIPLVL